MKRNIKKWIKGEKESIVRKTIQEDMITRPKKERMGNWRKHWGIKSARKGTGYPTSQSQWPPEPVSSLTGTSQRTDRMWDLALPFYKYRD